jgi:hypothetical protein
MFGANSAPKSTGTVRTDGWAILAAARRHLAGEALTRHTVAADPVDALNRAECLTCWRDRCLTGSPLNSAGCPVRRWFPELFA